MGNFLLQCAQCWQRLLILLQQYDALHHVAVFVVSHATHRRLKALLHRGNIAHQHGNIVLLRHYDRFDILNVPQQADRTHVDILRAQGKVIAADVGVAVLNRIHHLRQGDVMRQQSSRVHDHLVLARGPTKRRDIDNARNLFDFARDQPVLRRLQFIQAVARPSENVAINFANRRSRRELRLQIIRQRQSLQVIEHFLAIMEIIAVEAEVKLHIAQPENAGRAHLLQMWRTVNGVLHRDCDLLLHFLRGPGGVLRDDLDQRRRRIGIGLDVELGVRIAAHQQSGYKNHQHDDAVLQENADETRHLIPPQARATVPPRV